MRSLSREIACQQATQNPVAPPTLDYPAPNAKGGFLRGASWCLIVWLISCSLVLSSGGAAKVGAAKPAAFTELQRDLINQGLASDYVRRVFSDERAEFLPQVVKKIAYLKKERPADYSHFLRPEVVAKGRRFLATHAGVLQEAERRYGVAKEVIVAIMTVESDLGQVTGKYPVFNVFASLAVMDTPEVISDLNLDPKLLDRLRRKAAWGRSELAAFLSYCQQNRLDPFSIKGSWAGAFGYSQFLPSSLLRCGQDGDRDGRINLFCYPDAIFSIANYLKKAGFRLQDRSSWGRAVYQYNHSEPYVDTVLTLARWY